MTNTTQPQLPDEVKDKIFQEGQDMLAFAPDNKYSYIKGATEYAIKLIACDKANAALEEKIRGLAEENAQLKRWKMEAVELLTPINAYVHKHIEKSLGQSCVKLVLERCEQYEAARSLLEKVLEKYGHLYEWKSGLYNEIKTFLDGKK